MKGRIGRLTVLALVALSLAALVVGCQPQNGTTPTPQGEPEEQGTDSLRIEIVEQWAESGHARAVSFAAQEEGCKNCHDGLTFTTTGGGFQPRLEASEQSTETTGAAEGEEERDWVVSTDCRSCHTLAAVEIATQGSIEGVPNIETAEGGQGALCMACHNGWHGPGPGQEGNLAAPHYSVQTDMLFGVNTMQVDAAGATESTGAVTEEETESPHADVTDTCVGCHLSGDSPSHLFSIESWDGCEVGDCHDTDMTDGGDAAEDYDGDGNVEKVTAEIDGLMETLAAEINRAVGSTSFTAQGGNVVFEGGGRVRADDPEYAAAYNYLYVDKDGSRGVHNTQFTVRLLRDSIAAVSED